MDQSNSTENMKNKLSLISYKFFLAGVFHLINIIVTVTVNSFYVTQLIGDNSLYRKTLFLLELSIGLLKVIWVNSFIRRSARILEKITIDANSFAFKNRLLMEISNYIAAPCIATMAANQSCFYYVFKSPQPIIFSSLVIKCETFFCTVSKESTGTTKALPSFQYSYACGTSLLAAYIPVLIYSYTISGVLLVLFRILSALSINFMTLTSSSRLLSWISGMIDKDRIHGRNIVFSILIHFVVMLTFGIASPALAVVICNCNSRYKSVNWSNIEES